MGQPELTITLNPSEFFREKVSSALDKQKLKVSDDVEFYLVNLLCDFIWAPHKIQTGHGEIDLLDTPLALILKTALEAPSDEQVRIFKALGDTSLYISGYFQDYFNRKAFDIDYYMGLGANAYTQLSTLTRERYATSTYAILAHDFPQFVEVVAEVADTLGAQHRPSNLLALYDRWSRSQSERLRRRLEDEGITPIPSNMRTKQ